MKEIDSNKHAWGQISEGHYHHFKKTLLDGSHKLNNYRIFQRVSRIYVRFGRYEKCRRGLMEL